jgi:hypothetical protein
MLAKGYVNNDEETSKRFVHLPATGERLFRSGDIGSFRKDGLIEFWGRADSQVKIRGFRIELSEIESRLMEINGIKEVGVIVHTLSSFDKRLIAFYTLQNGAAPLRVETMKGYLHQHLPNYMIPADFVPIERFPSLPNGKRNYSELLAYYLSWKAEQTNTGEQLQTTINEVERKVRHIWENILGSTNFGNQDNFFDIGGHSLLILNVQEAMRKLFNREIPLVEFYKYTTIAAQARLFGDDAPQKEVIDRIRQRIQRRIQRNETKK